jgi:hypothetical protein
VFNDHAGVMSNDRAVVLHAALPHNKIANMGIVNLLVQSTGDAIKFPETVFSASRCFINGAERNFADCLAETNIDMRLPPMPITLRRHGNRKLSNRGPDPKARQILCAGVRRCGLSKRAAY